jgi:hypothetical protein
MSARGPRRVGSESTGLTAGGASAAAAAGEVVKAGRRAGSLRAVSAPAQHGAPDDSATAASHGVFC